MQYSDESDRASALEEMQREAAIENVRRSMGKTLKPIGRCYFCEDDDVPQGAVFCDNDCRDMWQREQDARRRNGGR